MKKLLFVGKLKKSKGIDFAINLMSLLNESYSLTIVGNGDTQKYKYLTDEKELTNICFEGFMPRNVIPQYYKSHDLTIIPSELEGFCLVAIESMYYGTPIIANDVPELNNFIIDNFNGLLCKKNNYDCYIRKINNLFGDSNLYNKIVRNGSEEALRHGVKQKALAMYNVYLAVLNG